MQNPRSIARTGQPALRLAKAAREGGRKRQAGGLGAAQDRLERLLSSSPR